MRQVAVILGVLAAVTLHAGLILFGGLIFPAAKKPEAVTAPVDLLGDVEERKDRKVDEEPKEKKEIEAETEQPPDASEILEKLDSQPSTDATPALEAASLSAIEAALSGQGGGGDFAQALTFEGGGRIGGTGKRGAAAEDPVEEAFSLSEIDQKPRAIFQASPTFPADMRGKKVEGVVSVIFVVDANGKVENPRIEKSSHAAFESPALAAVRKWKFEPGVRAGQRVASKMRVSIRFPQG